MTELRDTTIDEFLRELAARRATPAGGSAAAVTGSQAAALLAMCARYAEATVGVDDRPTVAAISAAGEAQMGRLVALADEDSRAFGSVMAARRLPKATEEEQAARRAAVASGYQEAARVPLHCAESCLATLQMGLQLAPLCPYSLLGDGLASLRLAHAALACSLTNVRINLALLTDSDFVAEAGARAGELGRQAEEAYAAAVALYRARLGFSDAERVEAAA